MHNDSNPIKASALALGETVSIRLKTGSGEPEAFLTGDIVASTPKAVRRLLRWKSSPDTSACSISTRPSSNGTVQPGSARNRGMRAG